MLVLSILRLLWREVRPLLKKSPSVPRRGIIARRGPVILLPFGIKYDGGFSMSISMEERKSEDFSELLEWISDLARDSQS